MTSASPFQPGDQVVAYLRDSGGQDQDLSVEQQESSVRKWCAANGLTLSRLFVDEASPGSSTVGRSGFVEMIEYFLNSHPPEKGVLVWKFSRFAREIDDAQYYKAALRRRGYQIHSMNENIPPGLDGRLFEAALDWMNARYLKDLSEDVRRGLHHNINTHGAIGGTPPRGFVRSADIHLGIHRNGVPHIVHRWDPDPELAPLVRRAWQMRSEGCSYDEIAAEVPLYKNKTGWKHFFENPIYKGELRYGPLIIPDYCAALVDAETWEAVQKMNLQKLETGMRVGDHPRAKSSDYILTGLLQCARCGAPMTGETVRSAKHNRTNRYYACTRKKRSFGMECRARLVPKEFCELTVLNEIADQILSLENLSEIQAETVAAVPARLVTARATLEELERQRATTRQQIDRLIDSLADIGRSEAISARVRLLEEESRRYDERIEQAKTEISEITNLPGDAAVQNLAERLPAVLRSADRPTLRRWLRHLIDHIDVERTNEKLTGVIYYYLPDELMPTQRSHRRLALHRHNFQSSHFLLRL